MRNKRKGYQNKKPLPSSPVGKEVKQLEFLATKIQYSKFNVQSCLVDIICTIVHWRISATFSKGVKGGIL